MGFDTIFWTVAIIVFAVAEAATTALISIWFAVGAGAALAVSLVTDSYGVQFLVFVLVSAAVLGVMVPTLAKRRREQGAPVTNGAPLTIGKQGVVIKAINPGAVGRVHVDGLDWQARAKEALPEGTVIRVVEVDGATLIVVNAMAAP